MYDGPIQAAYLGTEGGREGSYEWGYVDAEFEDETTIVVVF